MAQIFAGANQGLTAFRECGGKLLLHHGRADCHAQRRKGAGFRV
jgi:hypothetical protein